MTPQKVSQHGAAVEQHSTPKEHGGQKASKENSTPKTHKENGAIKASEHQHENKASESNGGAKKHQPQHMAKGKDAATKIVTSIPEVPVTGEREPFIIDDRLPQPALPRANLAATVAKPEGTTENDWARKHRHQTVLQQHCDFFDRDHDGIIWPQDTFVGFYRLGFGVILSFVALLVIHLNFAYPTQKSWIPDPRLLVNINNIDKDKHGGDTGTYDNEGRFVSQHFENIFAKYGEGRDYLTLSDLGKLWNGQRVLNDLPGMGAAIFEWFATYVMLWPKDGKMMKEDIRGIYDGSIFYTIAARREGKQKAQ